MREIDKETEPIRYIKAKVRKIQENPEISVEDKKIIYDLGKTIFLVNQKLNETVIEDSVEYGLRSFEMVYDLIFSKNKNYDKKVFEQIISYSQNVIDHLNDSQNCLDAIEAISDCLEAKVVCNNLFEKAKKSNKKP